MTNPWYTPFHKALRLGAYIASHTLVALLLIGVVSLIQWVVLTAGDIKLFEVLPLRYIFDAMDLGILVVFLVFGTLEAIWVFRE